MSLDILVVDDEADIRELVCGVLEDEGYRPRSAGDADSTLAALAERRPSLVLLDVWLQGSRLDGLQLLSEIKRRDATLPVIVFSGHGNLDTAVAAVRQGAVDFSSKSRSKARVCSTLSAAPRRPSGCGARMRLYGRRSVRRRNSPARPRRSTRCGPR